MIAPARRAAALGIAALAAAAIAAGCETTGDEDGDGASETRSTPVPAESEQPLTAAEEHGRELFVENCGSCHTLDAAGTQGAIGPNLDEAPVDEQQVLAAISEGPGAMPSDLVSGQDAQDVAAFVAASGPGG